MRKPQKIITHAGRIIALLAMVVAGDAAAYNRGTSPVVGGFSGTATYSGYNNVRGGCCGCWVKNGNTYTVANTIYGSVSYSTATAYVKNSTQYSFCDPGSGMQYLTMYINTQCPANTAAIQVKDYLRADGVLMSGVSTICVATDTY